MSPTIYFDGVAEVSEEFAANCARSAAALIELGIGPDGVVALMLHNEPVLIELMLATRATGARCCLINWHFKAAEVRHILSDSAAGVLIVHRDCVDQIREGIPTSVQVFVAEPRGRTREAFGLGDPMLGTGSYEYVGATARRGITPGGVFWPTTARRHHGLHVRNHWLAKGNSSVCADAPGGASAG